MRYEIVTFNDLIRNLRDIGDGDVRGMGLETVSNPLKPHCPQIAPSQAIWTGTELAENYAKDLEVYNPGSRGGDEFVYYGKEDIAGDRLVGFQQVYFVWEPVTVPDA